MPELKPDGCTCQSCGMTYRIDLNVPDELWEQIKPPGKSTDAGRLCGMCIMKRIEEIGEFGVLNADEARVRRKTIEKCITIISQNTPIEGCAGCETRLYEKLRVLTPDSERTA